MKTYQAGKDPVEPWSGDPRDWVFDLLENPALPRAPRGAGRPRPEAGGAGCEPCLRALVTDDWDYESLHHLGWCESCRGREPRARHGHVVQAARRHAVSRRALVVALAAGLAIAAPLAGNRLLDERRQRRRRAAGRCPGRRRRARTRRRRRARPRRRRRAPRRRPRRGRRRRRPRGPTPTTTPTTTPSTTPRRRRRRSRRSSPSRARARIGPRRAGAAEDDVGPAALALSSGGWTASFAKAAWRAVPRS